MTTPLSKTSDHPEIMDQAKHALERVQASSRDALDTVDAEIERRPYVAVAIASGVAFGVGTLLGSKLLRFAAMIGAGYAVTRLMSSRTGQRVKEIVSEEVAELASAVTHASP
jgi:hypothetical protein